jgi:hypothetical protein
MDIVSLICQVVSVKLGPIRKQYTANILSIMFVMPRNISRI